jgi:hypothetical protein
VEWDINTGDLFYIINGINTVSLAGDTVEKIGRTTGRTEGTVTAVCVDISQFRNGVDSGIDQLCQNQASYNADLGDSGSPVMLVPGVPASLFDIPLGTSNMLYGINWSGVPGGGQPNYFSPIANVLLPEELGPLQIR